MSLVGNVNNVNMQKCIDECMRCLQACEECRTLCLEEVDVKSRVHCIKILTDCIDICDLALKFMARGSQHAKHICKECVEICEICAQECGKFSDNHCVQCAEICRKCAAECRKMGV